MGDHQCGFPHKRSTTDNIFCILQILEKKWEYIRAVRQLFIDFNKACDSVRWQVLYNILTEFGNPVKWVGLKKYVRLKPVAVWVCKHLSGMLPIKNVLIQGDAISQFLFEPAFRVCHWKGSGKPGWLEIKWYTSASSLC